MSTEEKAPEVKIPTFDERVKSILDKIDKLALVMNQMDDVHKDIEALSADVDQKVEVCNELTDIADILHEFCVKFEDKRYVKISRAKTTTPEAPKVSSINE